MVYGVVNFIENRIRKRLQVLDREWLNNEGYGVQRTYIINLSTRVKIVFFKCKLLPNKDLLKKTAKLKIVKIK